MRHQQTLQRPAALSGVGLHTGVFADVRLLPAAEDFGIRFQRTDLPQAPLIPADVSLVSEVIRGTTLQKNNVQIHTVEHLLAALAGMEIDNARIEINGPEIPILDGSALPFVAAIQQSGIQQQIKPRKPWKLRQTLLLEEPESGAWIKATPAESLQITVSVDYQSPILGRQEVSLVQWRDFAMQIAPGRTFCFFHELEFLNKNGLIKGGDLSNAVVILDRKVRSNEVEYLSRLLNKSVPANLKPGILNPEKSRFPNEACRHKLLDLIGDLSLIGWPLLAHIQAHKPGHALNTGFARHVKKLIQEESIELGV